ncbi:anaerobic ribonucleoside-triphosphate reductase activating protein [Thermohalobacter berrensis]|uniref:Anaerobic ribonucleoside-triphosphate reductase activating protein n=1 Tax=Thermohalobacter berrensis TaxID=99594 RepID=A0A419T1A2_9FIRM|nr:anaerobic ribonucleoside-triphosphate reductase activating protein [Thermohalobacter berrensis]RKD31247.1 anaerobic ribonucleoside-triphosphate reductase activating protein [Thermohalobacter berrensis]
MYFKGHQKSSFIDYPDKISTVLFTGGCNFKCPYCHNSDLVYNKGEKIEAEYIFSFLEKRKKFIDAVCISGGEATLNKGLYDFVKELKDKGFLVKLDTNGTNPRLLKSFIKDKLLDYIAMDIKAPFNKYNKVTGVMVEINKIKESISLIRESDIDYEFRTTVCKELITEDDIINIAEELKGSKRYIIQNFRDGDTILAGKGRLTPYKKEELKDIERKIKDNFIEFKVRS